MEGKVLKIREIGDPVLNKKSKNIPLKEIQSEETKELIANLKATFEYNGGLGLAAPQIGENINVIIIKVEKEKCTYKDVEDVPLTIMINPKITIVTDKTDIQFEACFSVPGSVVGKVERFLEVDVSYYTEDRQLIKRKASGFFARLLQHETDHLKGEMFMYKLTSPRDIATTANIKKFKL